MESSNIHALPPSKRFKLLHQKQPLEDPSILRKRPDFPQIFPLPAKKRIWANRPREMNDPEEDDGVICAVCGSTDGEPLDPIVFCDGCDLTVHVTCYGSPLIQSVPEGDWFCLRCESKGEEGNLNLDCCLCPKKGGAVKPVEGGRQWAHVLCALLVPEAFFRDPVGRVGIDCSRVPQRRRKIRCYICGLNRGCGIRCSEPSCGLGFHASCGWDSSLNIEYKELKGGAGIVAGFCHRHTKLWKKQELTGKFKIVPRKKLWPSTISKQVAVED